MHVSQALVLHTEQPAGHAVQFLFLVSTLYPEPHVLQSNFVSPIIGVGLLSVQPVWNDEHL